MSSATSVIRQVVSGSRIRESSLLSSHAFICRIQRGVLPRPHAIEIVVRNTKAFQCAVSRCRKRDVHPYHLDVVMDRSGIPVVGVVLEIAAFRAVTATWHEGRRVVAEATWRVAWLACRDHPNAAIAPTHAAREPGSACPSLLNSRRRSHATSTRSDGILADIRWELAPVRQGHPMRGRPACNCIGKQMERMSMRGLVLFTRDASSKCKDDHGRPHVVTARSPGSAGVLLSV